MKISALRCQYRRLYTFDVVGSIAAIVSLTIAPHRWQVILLIAIVTCVHLLMLGRCAETLAQIERANDHDQLMTMLKSPHEL